MPGKGEPENIPSGLQSPELATESSPENLSVHKGKFDAQSDLESICTDCGELKANAMPDEEQCATVLPSCRSRVSVRQHPLEIEVEEEDNIGLQVVPDLNEAEVEQNVTNAQSENDSAETFSREQPRNRDQPRPDRNCLREYLAVCFYRGGNFSWCLTAIYVLVIIVVASMIVGIIYNNNRKSDRNLSKTIDHIVTRNFTVDEY